MVMLYQELSDDEPGLLCADQAPSTARTGRALREGLEDATYLVRFTDGEEPETGQGLMTWDSQWMGHCARGIAISGGDDPSPLERSLHGTYGSKMIILDLSNRLAHTGV